MTLCSLIIFSLTLLRTALTADINLPPSCGTTKRHFMAVLFRHGERAPLGTFHGDPNPNHRWPFGFGELTKDGRDRMNYLGMWLRNSLGDFMTSDVRDVGARSSPVPRCFDSAALFLYGLYPSSGNWTWKDNEDWQPVPITSMPKDHDKYTFYCPILLKKMLTGLPSMLAGNGGSGGQLLSILSKNTKINVSEKPRQLLDALDALVVQAENNLNMPEWFRSQKDKFLEFNHKMYIAIGGALSKNMGAEIIRDIAAKVKEHHYPKNVTKVSNDIMKPLDVPYNIAKKLHLFSYHDLNLIAVLYSLNPAEIKKRPDYGSLVMFETVRHPGVEEPQIRVLYRDGETEHVVYNMTGCPYPCTVKKFVEYVEENFKPMTAEECGIPDDYILL